MFVVVVVVVVDILRSTKIEIDFLVFGFNAWCLKEAEGEQTGQSGHTW